MPWSTLTMVWLSHSPMTWGCTTVTSNAHILLWSYSSNGHQDRNPLLALVASSILRDRPPPPRGPCGSHSPPHRPVPGELTIYSLPQVTFVLGFGCFVFAFNLDGDQSLLSWVCCPVTLGNRALHGAIPCLTFGFEASAGPRCEPLNEDVPGE